MDKYFPKEAVKQENDFDLVLDSSVACAAKTIIKVIMMVTNL
jgi:hypothetical protein